MDVGGEIGTGWLENDVEEAESEASETVKETAKCCLCAAPTG